MNGARRYIARVFFLGAGVLFGLSLVFADEKSKEIAWQDYAKATTAAKKANKPVLIDFWRPG